jgi:hypothetical protein
MPLSLSSQTMGEGFKHINVYKLIDNQIEINIKFKISQYRHQKKICKPVPNSYLITIVHFKNKFL